MTSYTKRLCVICGETFTRFQALHAQDKPGTLTWSLCTMCWQTLRQTHDALTPGAVVVLADDVDG